MSQLLFSDWYDDPFPPAEPTDALPGTPEKIAALERRLRSNQGLWHPYDPIDPLERAKRATRVLRNGRNASLENIDAR